MKEILCDVPSVMGKRIVAITKTVSDEEGLDVEKVSFTLDDGSFLVVAKEGGEARGIEWAEEVSVRHKDNQHKDNWIADLSF